MRISRKAKEENRKKILKTATTLFTEKGFEKTTTRDIATVMGMASGTMFNYFASKHALAMTLALEALERGRRSYARRRAGCEGFVEDLFLLITSELRMLKPYRAFIGPVLESAMSLFAKSTVNAAGEKAKKEHLEIVEKIMTHHGHPAAPSFMSINLYWTLYLGILAFWSTDESKNQEETLAFIDYALQLFAQTISGSPCE